MTHDRLAELVAETAGERSAECIAIETIHELVTGQLEAQRAAEVRAHVADCAFCQAEARLAGWFEDPVASPVVDQIAAQLPGGRRAAGPRPVAARARAGATVAAPRRWNWMPFGLAAAAVLVLAVGMFTLAPPAVPELSRGGVVRGGQIELLAPRGPLAEAPEQVVWEGGTAERYRVELLAVDDSVLWFTASGESVEVPMTARNQLRPGVPYRVRVTPVDPDGAPLGEGVEAEFRIESPQVE